MYLAYMFILLITLNSTQSVCFCSGWLITLASMSTYIFHRLIIEKLKLTHFVSVSKGLLRSALF